MAARPGRWREAAESPRHPTSPSVTASLPLAEFGALPLLVAALAFFAGGISKGVTGLGLPLIAVPVMATAIDPRTAIAMMVVPTLTANAWIVYRGGRAAETWRRFWPLLLFMVVFTILGAQLLVRVDAATASLLLGLGLLLFCLTQVLPFSGRITPRMERWAGPAVGGVAGLMGGTTNFFGPPLVAYLTALRLPKDAFVASITFVFLITTFPLYGSLAAAGVLTLEIAAASAVAAVVVLAGVGSGGLIRKLVSQETFQRVLVAMLFLIALNLIRRGIGWP